MTGVVVLVVVVVLVLAASSPASGAPAGLSHNLITIITSLADQRLPGIEQ